MKTRAARLRRPLQRPSRSSSTTLSQVLFWSLVSRHSPLLLTLCLLAVPSRAAIHYEVSLANPEQHLFHVSMEIPDVHDQLKLQMAAWNALYEIRDFSSHVQQVEASANGQQVAIEKLDKLTWRVKANGTITVKYATFWDDVGPFNTQLNAEHAFVNPAMILLYVPDRRAEECTLLLTGIPLRWKVASATQGHARPLASRDGAWDFTAPSFDALADGPIEVSNFEEFTIHDLSPPVRVILHGDNYKKHDVESALRKICAYEVKLMEGAPYDQYTFIFHIGKAAGGGGGGMEHANSTAIYVPSGDYLANVSAHEYFHLWNVKRIRPATLEPVDYTHEMYTRALWFAEGVTNTYGSYTLVRTGIWNKQEFYLDLASQITELETRPAEHWQSAEQSSLDTWLDKYDYYDDPQVSISYYNKGQILGVMLDLAIRDATDNRESLDGVLRAMNADYAQRGRFYDDSAGVEQEVEKISGRSFREFFAKYVAGTDEIPYDDFLRAAGLQAQTQQRDMADFGFDTSRGADGSVTIASVTPGSGAQQAGLQAGDVLLQLDGHSFGRSAYRFLFQHSPGDTVKVRIQRSGSEREISFALAKRGVQIYSIAEIPGASERQKRVREGMLRGTTN